MSCCPIDDRRQVQADDERHHRGDETGKGAGHANIEQRAPIHDRGTLYAELFRPFLLMAFALLAAEITLRLTRFSRMP